MADIRKYHHTIRGVRALVDFAILADSAALYECRKIIEIFIYVCYNTDIYEYVGIGNIINIGVI